MDKKYGLFNKQGDLLAIATSRTAASEMAKSQGLLCIPLADEVNAFKELIMQRALDAYPAGESAREWIISYARIVSLSTDWISPDAGPAARCMLTWAAAEWATTVNNAITTLELEGETP